MRTFFTLVLVLMSICSAHAGELVILPETITLRGPEARQALIVERVEDGRMTGQVHDVAFSSDDPAVARIEDGAVVPAGNGSATITAKSGEQTAHVTVQVADYGTEHVWSFRNHVQPVLTSAGCNSGACHGAASGKNGFKLSLRGYDPAADFHTITRQSRGRRIVPSDPGRSMLLTKPTGAIPHKGGFRFTTGSLEYRVLSEWIAAGHPGPSPSDPQIERLEIIPDHVFLEKGDVQQVLVRAHFSDGHAEDVTRWAKFDSTNSVVASVDENGLVTIEGHGEGAISAWYLSKTVIGTVTVPYDQPLDPDIFESEPRANLIDRFTLAKMQELNLPPSPPASDGEFMRRAYLDTIGVLPTPEEARRFLADPRTDKRVRLVDELLTRPEFVDYWSNKWSDLLLVSGKRLRPAAVNAYYEWIRARVMENTPWDEFARQLVTAKGNTLSNGATNFYSLHQDPLEMAETVSMAFLGMSINCARCHDHPLEKWTNDDYYGMANMFSRVRGKGWGGDFRNGDGDREVFSAERGELIQPRTGRPQPPRPLDGAVVPMHNTRDRRIPLAEWLTSPENPYFTRAIVNRVWANFMGVGIVEKVDDLRLTNPPSNERLLAALSEELIRNDYDLKTLMRLILTSRTYQRSSKALPGNESDKRFYSRFYPRRIKAEVLLDAISQVTGTPTKFKRQIANNKWEDLPVGTRALQLRDTSVDSYFLETFGRPERLITCECERSNEPSMVQVLHIVNGKTINAKLKDKASRAAELLKSDASDEAIIDELYLATLTRYPTEEEKQQILKVFAESSPDERRAVIEDLCWGLLSSREFLFNH